jgi:two-component system, LuxR family, response regulator FixJ
MQTSPLIEVVEDDAEIRRMMARVIEMMGYRVRCHESALAYLAAAPAEDAAVMILDIRMPGMSGVELKAHLERQGQHTPVIFMSGDTHASDLDSPQVRNAVAFLWKPFGLDQLEQAVEKALAMSHH